MSRPEQNDYGQDGDSTALVPGSLIAYRHFQVDLSTGQIAPMNYRASKKAAMGGTCQAPYPLPTIPAIEGGQTYKARCVKPGPASFYSRLDRERRGELHEKSPTVWCTCGFYAHYDPDTDFYESTRWGRLYYRLAGSEEASNTVVVRAVVEVSGTTIMGTLGVRAEKMKILAMAIDWEKRVKPSPVDRFNFIMNRQARLALSPADVYRDVMDGFDDLGDFDQYEDDDKQDAAHVAWVADRYRVKMYDNVREMYADYPKPDVSALIQESAPEPESLAPYFEWDSTPIDWGQVSSIAQDSLQAQAQLYASTIDVDTVKQIFSGFKPSMVIVDEIIDWSTESNFQRAMRLKKERPAPPGTGIDRRRGKLR